MSKQLSVIQGVRMNMERGVRRPQSKEERKRFREETIRKRLEKTIAVAGCGPKIISKTGGPGQGKGITENQ